MEGSFSSTESGGDTDYLAGAMGDGNHLGLEGGSEEGIIGAVASHLEVGIAEETQDDMEDNPKRLIAVKVIYAPAILIGHVHLLYNKL